MNGMDQEPAGLAVGLEVEPRHKPVAEQEGHDIVAVLPLVRRRIDLDPVVEAEEAEGAGPLPDERVEGARSARAERRRGRGARQCRKREPSPARDLDRPQDARFDEDLNGGFGLFRAETEIIAQLQSGGDAKRQSRALKSGVRLTLVRRW